MTSPVLVNIGVRLHVAVKHGLVNTRIVALVAFEGFRAVVVTKVILEVVLVLRHERTLWTLKTLVVFNVHARVFPVFLLNRRQHVRA